LAPLYASKKEKEHARYLRRKEKLKNPMLDITLNHTNEIINTNKPTKITKGRPRIYATIKEKEHARYLRRKERRIAKRIEQEEKLKNPTFDITLNHKNETIQVNKKFVQDLINCIEKVIDDISEAAGNSVAIDRNATQTNTSERFQLVASLMAKKRSETNNKVHGSS
jgi:hypothetical protein